jgi:AbrB family looped-hinge helix DNA binding protein
MEHELQFKKIKVSQKGQIAIPADIQKRMGIKKGDELLLISKGKKIILEKQDRILTQLKDEFKDMEVFSEHSLKKIWFNKKDDIWDQ